MEMTTYVNIYTCSLSRSPKLIVPVALAIIANTPKGAMLIKVLVMRLSPDEITESGFNKTSLFFKGISADPRKKLNTTTAGTVLLASELNKFEGIYNPKKLNGGFFSIILALKKDAISQLGNANGVSKTNVIPINQRTNKITPLLLTRRIACSEDKLPSPLTSETIIYGSTVICISIIKASPKIFRKATCSPKKIPNIAPIPKPKSTLVDKLNLFPFVEIIIL